MSHKPTIHRPKISWLKLMASGCKWPWPLLCHSSVMATRWTENGDYQKDESWSELIRNPHKQANVGV